MPEFDELVSEEAEFLEDAGDCAGDVGWFNGGGGAKIKGNHAKCLNETTFSFSILNAIESKIYII